MDIHGKLPAALNQVFHAGLVVNDGTGVRQDHHVGIAASGRGPGAGFEGFLVFEAGVAKIGEHIQPSGRNMQARDVYFLGCRTGDIPNVIDNAILD